MTAAATAPTALWYLTRGTGLLSLILLTATVSLGVLTQSRWKRPQWPRFATVQLHRYTSLLVVALLAIHILTAELDTFAPVGWPAVLIPFASSYRAVWLGLGTVAFDLLLAVVVTSLLRGRLGYRTWRAVHWFAYLSWPVALIHGLGTGSDARFGWAQFLYFISICTVLIALSWRLAHGERSTAAARLLGGIAAAAVLGGVLAWARTGPLDPGWARRAGTPPRLLAAARGVQAPSGQASTGVPSSGPVGAPPGLPALPFDGRLAGTLTQSDAGDNGQVRITVDTTVSGAMTGTLVVVLRGQRDGGGVAMSSSDVSFGPVGRTGEYRGQVVALDGNQVVAVVRAQDGRPVELAANLQIDPGSGSVGGTLHAQSAPTG